MSHSWDPMDCSLPDSSRHGILQARILEWVAIFFSRGSSPPRDQTCISCIGRRILYLWATWEALDQVYEAAIFGKCKAEIPERREICEISSKLTQPWEAVPQPQTTELGSKLNTVIPLNWGGKDQNVELLKQLESVGLEKRLLGSDGFLSKWSGLYKVRTRPPESFQRAAAMGWGVEQRHWNPAVPGEVGSSGPARKERPH